MTSIFDALTRNPDSFLRPTSVALVASPGSCTSLAALVARADASDPSFRSHADNVAWLSMRIGAELGLAADELRALELAAAFHDVGKVHLPTEVIGKRGPLDAEEWRAMRRHPVEGQRLLEPLVASGEVLAIVRSHHERWDGEGYPDGLCADEIPFGARIVAVADAFSAMTEQRPYRTPRTIAAARLEMLRLAGQQFDAACAKVAFQLTEPG